jgi:hypothetical protein
MENSKNKTDNFLKNMLMNKEVPCRQRLLSLKKKS